LIPSLIRKSGRRGFVVDASVGVSWVVNAQASSETVMLLEQVADGEPLVVPGLWMMEVANSLLVLVRRMKIPLQHCERARGALTQLNPVIDDRGPRMAMHRIWELAHQHALSVYDATYLELARREALPLATRDRGLRRAAETCGVKLLV
jgi:predicted nucleic acid-binding protein